METTESITINDELAIPLHELTFRFTTSSGPGGQHANRSATAATLLFDIANSPGLTDWQRSRLLDRLGTRVDKEGVLQVHAQATRSQSQNRQLAIDRFQELLAQALKPEKKRRKTKPSPAAKERRLFEKKQRGERKRQRGRDWTEEVP